MYPLCGQSNIVADAADGLRDAGWVGGVENGRERFGLFVSVIVEIAAKIEGNRASNQHISLGRGFHLWGMLFRLWC